MNSYNLFDEKHWEHAGSFEPARYESNDTQLNKMRAHATLSIFSQGQRMCPAHIISEYLFKTFFAYIIYHYDFILTNTNSERRENFHITLSLRTENISLENQQKIT